MKRTLIAAGFALLTTPVYAQPPSAEAIITDNDRNGDKGLSKEEWSPQAPIGVWSPTARLAESNSLILVPPPTDTTRRS